MHRKGQTCVCVKIKAQFSMGTYTIARKALLSPSQEDADLSSFFFLLSRFHITACGGLRRRKKTSYGGSFVFFLSHNEPSTIVKMIFLMGEKKKENFHASKQ